MQDVQTTCYSGRHRCVFRDPDTGHSLLEACSSLRHEHIGELDAFIEDIYTCSCDFVLT